MVSKRSGPPLPTYYHTRELTPQPPPTTPPSESGRICDLTFLGTASGKPTRSRSASSVYFRWCSTALLVDCGEGTMRQFNTQQHCNPVSLEGILITHLHGDHLYGLQSMLLHASQVQHSILHHFSV